MLYIDVNSDGTVHAYTQYLGQRVRVDEVIKFLEPHRGKKFISTDGETFLRVDDTKVSATYRRSSEEEIEAAKPYKVPYKPRHIKPAKEEEYWERTPVVLETVVSLIRETGIVISEESDTMETLRFEAVHGITLSLLEDLHKSFAGIVDGRAYVGFEDKYYEATIGEVMEFMAAHEGCTLNGVAKCYYSKVDGDDEPYIRDLYITSMVYTGKPTSKFMADFRRLMPLKENPHRDEFLILANSDDGTDRR